MNLHVSLFTSVCIEIRNIPQHAIYVLLNHTLVHQAQLVSVISTFDAHSYTIRRYFKAFSHLMMSHDKNVG